MLAGVNMSFAQNLPHTNEQKAKISIEVPNEAKPRNTEEIVKEYFKNTPLLAHISYCESRFTQFDKNGEIFRGRQNPDDVGVMQINTKYHLKESKKLGMDIYTLKGNLEYGKYLYEHQGSAPWNASSPCWIPRSGMIAMK